MPEVSYIGSAPMVAKMLEGAVKGVTLSAEDLVGQSQQAVGDHVVTGALKAGIHVESIDVSTDEVKAKVATGGESNDYAVFVHEGTAAHRIEGNPFLAFDGIVVRSVNHPGTAAVKFLEGPLVANRGRYMAFIAAAAKL